MCMVRACIACTCKQSQVEHVGFALGLAAETLRGDKEIIMAAVRFPPSTFSLTHEGMHPCSTRALMHAQMTVQCKARQFHIVRMCAHAQVDQDGMALQYASAGLRNNQAVVMAASWSTLLQFIQFDIKRVSSMAVHNTSHHLHMRQCAVSNVHIHVQCTQTPVQARQAVHLSLLLQSYDNHPVRATSSGEVCVCTRFCNQPLWTRPCADLTVHVLDGRTQTSCSACLSSRQSAMRHWRMRRHRCCGTRGSC